MYAIADCGPSYLLQCSHVNIQRLAYLVTQRINRGCIGCTLYVRLCIVALLLITTDIGQSVNSGSILSYIIQTTAKYMFAV